MLIELKGFIKSSQINFPINIKENEMKKQKIK